MSQKSHPHPSEESLLAFLDGEVSLNSELYRSRGNFGGVVGSLEV